MNKRKTALFVEGKTEYIFVRDFLCAWYDYDAERMGIECYAFRADKKDSYKIRTKQHSKRPNNRLEEKKVCQME